MSPTFREQICSSIQTTERQLEQLRAQPQPDQTTIAGDEKELRILRRKLEAMPEDTTERRAIYA